MKTAENNINTENQNRFPVPIEMNFHMSTIKGTKSSMSRVLKAYSKGQIEHITFRNIIYFFSQYINALKHESDLRIEDRLKDLENKINDQLSK